MTLERETYDLFLELKRDITLTINMSKHQSDDSKLQQKLITIIKGLTQLRRDITKSIAMDKSKDMKNQTQL